VETLRATSVGEAAAHSVTHGVRGRANTLSGVRSVIRNEAVLAVEAARLLDITDGLAVVGVTTLLLRRLLVDQVREEVAGSVVSEEFGNILTNGVISTERRQDGETETDVKVAGD